jgi:hypothetical protein
MKETYYPKNKELILKMQRIKYNNHPIERQRKIEISKKYWEEHKEERRAYAKPYYKEYYLKNKDNIRKTCKIFDCKNTLYIIICRAV